MAEEQRDASDHTEDPTQKKLDEALKRGDVAKSQEVNTWFVVAGAALVLLAFSHRMAGGLTTSLRGLIANSYDIPLDGHALLRMLGHLEAEVLAAIAIPFLLLALAAILGNVAQHRLVWSAQALQPKLEKISPLAGFKRLFSKQALANFIKGVAKLALVGAIMAAVIWPQRTRLDALIAADPGAILPFTRTMALGVLGAVVAVMAVIAGGDFLFQYRVWFERQKMSLRELKEEFKQTEGDPMMKGRIKQVRVARMRKRMIAEVPKASVVITNPTHYAVALKYERGMNAPLCLAKGV